MVLDGVGFDVVTVARLLPVALDEGQDRLEETVRDGEKDGVGVGPLLVFETQKLSVVDNDVVCVSRSSVLVKEKELLIEHVVVTSADFVSDNE